MIEVAIDKSSPCAVQAGKRKRGKGEIAEERTSSLSESVSGAAENIR